MWIGESDQYGTACVFVEEGDHLGEVLEMATDYEAWFYEDLDPDSVDARIVVYVVCLPERRHVGPEVYTYSALIPSFPDGCYKAVRR